MSGGASARRWLKGRRRLAVPLAAAAVILAGCGEGDAGTTSPGASTAATVPAQPPPEPPADRSECDLFAAVGGSDRGGDGSLANPWQHVDFLVGKLRDEDGFRVGCLRSGTYTPTGADEAGGEPSTRFDRPNVTLMSFPGERARVIGRIYVSDLADGAAISDLDLAMQSNLYPGSACTGICGNSSFPIAGSGVTVSGNDISNDDTDICVQLIDNGSGAADDAVISGNRIHNCGPYEPRSNTAHAIYVNNSTNPAITDNVIYDNGAFGVKLAPRAVGGTVTGNVLDLNSVGVLVGDQPPCPTTEEASRDNLIADNVVTRSQGRNNIEGFWATPVDDPSCFEIGGDTRGNVVSGNCLYADNPDSDGPDDFYNVNGGLGLRSEDTPQSGGFTDDGTNLILAPSAQPTMPPVYADPVNGGYHLLDADGDGNDCLEAESITDRAAAANSRWTAPTALATATGARGADPVAAVGPDGAAATAWVDGGAVWALGREPGGQTGPTRWSPANPSAERPPPVRISGAGDGASGVRIGVGGSGSDRVIVAAWRRAGGDGDGVALESATWSDGSWGEPTTLEDAGAGTPAVAVGVDGTAIVAWRRGEEVKASVRPAGAALFGEPQVLSSAEAAEPRVAVGADGATVAAWSAQEGEDRVIEAAGYDGSAWSAPETLSRPGGEAVEPDLAMAPAAGGAEAVAVWRRNDGSGWVAESALRSADGSWGDPAPLSAAGAGAEGPSAGMGADGAAVATWVSRDGDGRVVEASTRPTGGGFGEPEQLSGSGPTADARVAVGADGAAIAVWAGVDAEAGINRVVAATRVPGGEWSSPATLSTFAPGVAASVPWPAIGPTAGALAVWAERAGAGTAITSADFWF